MSAGDWKDMIYAIREGDIDVVQYHIEQGVDPNHQHPEFMTTALVESISCHQYDIAVYLLQSGADPLLKLGFSTDTAMSIAKRTKNKEMIELIKSHLPTNQSWLSRNVNKILRRS